MRCCTVILTLVVAASAAGAQPPRIGVDQRVELMAILFRLAGNEEYSNGKLERYVSDIDRHFGPHRSHRAVALARDLAKNQEVGYDAVMSLAAHISDPPELLERVPFDVASASSADERLRSVATRRFLAEARLFATASRADSFFAAHQALYDSANARMRRLVETRVDLKWFGRFFGAPPGEDFIVVPLLAASGGNFGVSVRLPGARPELYAVIGHYDTDSTGNPTYDRDLWVDLLVHEFGHSFVNPVAYDAHRAEFARSAPRIQAAVAEQMRLGGYGDDSKPLVNESVLRAAVVRYVLASRGGAAARATTAWEQGEGFLWTGELADLLGEYEANRGTYPTFAAFMPRVVAYFDSLPPRVEELRRRYDATRPRVVGMSIENGAPAVDPTLTEITVRFDRQLLPGSRSGRPVAGKEAQFPKITHHTLDSTGTVLRLGVELAPDHPYEFMLNHPMGGGIRSMDNVPLAPYRIWFQTRAAGSAVHASEGRRPGP